MKNTFNRFIGITESFLNEHSRSSTDLSKLFEDDGSYGSFFLNARVLPGSVLNAVSDYSVDADLALALSSTLINEKNLKIYRDVSNIIDLAASMLALNDDSIVVVSVVHKHAGFLDVTHSYIFEKFDSELIYWNSLFSDKADALLV